MSDALFTQLLNFTVGAMLLTAVLILWWRELSSIIVIFGLQGIALAATVALIATHEGSAELGVVAVLVLVLRAGVLPWLLRRTLAAAGPNRRETRPLVNVVTSLLVAAGLTLLAYAVAQPLVALDTSPTGHAVPAALAVALTGFFVLVTRRLALSQLVGFLLLDNGITAVGILTTAEIGLVVELGISMDVLLVVLVLQVLKSRIRAAFGRTDIDELRELHD